MAMRKSGIGTRLNKTLPRTWKNAVFVAISSRGLEPSEFEWTERTSKRYQTWKVNQLTHRPTDYYFIFDFEQGGQWSEFSPGKDDPAEIQFPGSWQGQLRNVDTWLDRLKVEIESPDLWDFVGRENELAKAASEDQAPDKAFEPNQRKAIAARMREVEQYLVKTQDLSQGHADFVRKRLQYLSEAAERQTRRDWINTTIGVLFTIAVGVGLNSEGARELFRFVASILRDMLGGLLPLP